MEQVKVIRSERITCRHGFSTRLGGVSEGTFQSLNLGANRGDSLANVQENWRRFAAAVGAGSDRSVHGCQSHGVTVRIARRGDEHSIAERAAWEEADGYVTDEPDLPLAVFTADCTPLLMQDPEAGVIAAVHCGWRSTVADIERRAVEVMASLHARPERIRAAIGPGIRQCCFQTGPEVPRAIDALLGGASEGLFVPDERVPGKYQVDLPGAVYRRLLQLGLREENIDELGICTMCHPELFWSHRAMGAERGSQANMIVL